MDRLTPQQRSKQMSLVKSKNTNPEIFVRLIIYSLGYRYRLHAEDLPGKPDIVFRNKKKVIFVNGCFWHGHDSHLCRRARMPKSRQKYWKTKIAKNRQRDKENVAQLGKLNWKVLILWECELNNVNNVLHRLTEFLSPQLY